jgi:hypothetical protein
VTNRHDATKNTEPQGIPKLDFGLENKKNVIFWNAEECGPKNRRELLKVQWPNKMMMARDRDKFRG